ncbi:hypothetical protein M0R04_07960 [Candidatus Dojkabacteria bacterium]|nr:hypothetical protein [Candidatus Dojkabacteria bacterium]
MFDYTDKNNEPVRITIAALPPDGQFTDGNISVEDDILFGANILPGDYVFCYGYSSDFANGSSGFKQANQITGKIDN